MSSNATGWHTTPPDRAYPRLRRVIHAFRFIRDRAAESAAAMEETKAKHVARTYGVEAELVKRIKARFRNELSFGGSDK